jgi:exonuclease III
MNCNLLIWNVRGLNDQARRSVVCAVIRKYNVAVVCIQETKLQMIDLAIVYQCCGPLFSEFVFDPAAGTRGGILIAWKPDEFQMTAVFTSAWSVAMHGSMCKSQKNINLISVYGPQSDGEKRDFLQQLHDRITDDLPPSTATILAGDFNLIVQASDKNNRNLNRRNMAAFRGFINNLQLKDLYMHGRRYTWSNEQQPATMVRLDRVLFNQEWDAEFPGCLLQALSSEMSDHCPMLLSTDAGFKPVRRFRFENMWVSREDFIPTVQAAWNSTPVQIDPFINLHTKLSVVAKALTSWSACFVSDLDLRAAITSELILRLDQAMDSTQLTNEEIQFRAALKVNRLGISALQRTMWRQRSRIQWLREGDASTRFFPCQSLREATQEFHPPYSS